MVDGAPAELPDPGRIVIFGATGNTGSQTARALVARGARPVLAGRSAERLAPLAAELGDLEWRVADAGRPASVRALVEGPEDVLIATVGPFAKYGEPAVRAAIDAGAIYLDSTGEPAFVREVFEVHGPAARASGALLLCAQGYDYVPGALAGALVLAAAGPEAVRVDVGYFAPGSGPGALSAGTRRSLVGAGFGSSFAFRDGALRTVPIAERIREFPVAGETRTAVSIGGAEHFGLPATHPRLREVNVHLGWFGGLARPLQIAARVGAVASRVPGVAAGLQFVGERLAALGGDSGTAPGAGSSAWIAAEAYDAGGVSVAALHLTGVDGYTFTARFLAWAAERLATSAADSGPGAPRPPGPGGLGRPGPGALGPVEAYGLDALERGCAEAGIGTA